jgi:hypothetical protein
MSDTIGDLVVTKLNKPAGRCVYGVAGDSLTASTEVLRRDAQTGAALGREPEFTADRRTAFCA